MFLSFLDLLLPECIWYDNTAKPLKGEYITLSFSNVSFKDNVINIKHPILKEITFTLKELYKIYNNSFIDGNIFFEKGRLEYHLNENLYRLYDSEGNWVRVSRENLLNILRNNADS